MNDAPEKIYVRSLYANDVMGGVYHLQCDEKDMIEYRRTEPEIKEAQEQDVLENALNLIATETCDHGAGFCPREVANEALRRYAKQKLTAITTNNEGA